MVNILFFVRIFPFNCNEICNFENKHTKKMKIQIECTFAGFRRQMIVFMWKISNYAQSSLMELLIDYSFNIVHMMYKCYRVQVSFEVDKICLCFWSFYDFRNGLFFNICYFACGVIQNTNIELLLKFFFSSVLTTDYLAFNRFQIDR